jgi:hypothetical protein
MAVYLTQKLPREKVVRVDELQERLEFRTKQAELPLLTDKINIYGEVLNILKK